MASHDSNKSKDSSPNHPMVLRSACRLCCSEDLSYSAGGRVVSHRSARGKHLNGDPLHFHHHHHHKGYSNTNEKYGEQDAGYVDGYLSRFVDSHSGSATQKEKTSEKTALQLADSLQASSIAHLISSPLSISTVSTKLISSSSTNYSSTTSYKEVYSDYSSGNESSEFFCEDKVNNFCFKEDMSLGQVRSRTPLASVRLLSGSESEIEDSIIKTSAFQGRHNEEERARRVYHLNNSVNESLSASFLRSDRSKQLHKSASSKRNNFYSGEGSSDENLSSYENHKEEASYASSFSKESSFPCPGFMFILFRWMFWRCIYLTICEVLLFDTWLLSRCYTYGKKKCLFLFLLLFIPLLFLVCTGGNRASSDQLSDAMILETSEDPSLEYSFFSGVLFRRNEKESGSTVCTGNSENIQSIWSYLANLFSSTEKVDSLELEAPAESVVSSTSESDLDISAQSVEVSDDEKMKLLALEVFRRESAKLLSQFEERRKQDQAKKDTVEVKHSDIGRISIQYQSLSDSLQEFKNEVSKQIKSNMDGSPQLLILGSKLQDLEEKLASFESALESAKNCCGNDTSYTSAESQLTLLMMKVMEGNEDGNHPIVAAFRNWLRASFISRTNLSDEISSVIKQMYGSLHLSEEHYEDIAKRVAESVISQSMKSFENDIIKMSKTTSSSFSMGHYSTETSRIDDIQQIIKEAILLYDADKTGRVDYALESGGGSIISTRCSETYNAGTARISIFGLPLWSSSKSPRTAIQPEVQPGECWAFHGSQGFLVIQLSATIRPNGFSLEHIPKSLSPLGNIDSAPKDFSVWGLMSENNDEGKLLGKFQYNSDGDPVQYFPVENETENFYSIIELKIHSNWGNQKYTCLYRFRVHGTPL